MIVSCKKSLALAVVLAALVGALGVAVPAGVAATTSASEDDQIAQGGVLVASDLPSTWSQHARDKSSDKFVDAAAAKIPSCKRYREFRKETQSVKRARKLSPDFELGQSSFNNTVNVFSNEAAAQRLMKIFGSSAVPTCIEKLFALVFRQQLEADKQTASQVKGVAVQIDPYDVANYGDETVAYEGNVSVKFKDGTTLKIGLGNTAVRVGRAVDDFSYTVFDQAAVDALSPAVTSSVARLQAAL